MAVITAAAAAGWRLAEVRAELAAGRWAGLAGLYARPGEPRRMARLLPAEWRKSVAFASGEENMRNWLTSDVKSRPPTPIDGADEFGLIRPGTPIATAKGKVTQGNGVWVPGLASLQSGPSAVVIRRR